MVGAAILIPLALAVDRPFDLTLAPETTVSWIALGLFPSGIAYLIFFTLVRQVSAGQDVVLRRLAGGTRRERERRRDGRQNARA